MEYDLVVIGGGSGGVRCARIAASLGARVAIVGDTYWGGTCVNVGCVPKKIYHYAASIKSSVQLAEAYGWQVSLGNIDWKQFHSNKDNEIQRLNSIYGKLLDNAGCDVINGHGKIINSNTVLVTTNDGLEQSLNTKRILIAVGAAPHMPEIPGIEHGISSDDLFGLDMLPKRLLVVGGGYIACEMASIFHKLGVEVTMAVRSQLLKSFDRESVTFLKNELIKDGLNIHTESSPTQLNKTDSGICVDFSEGSSSVYDEVLFATGRKPRFDNLGLEHVGVTFDEKGFIEVNEFYETAEKNIYAVGDVIDHLELTPVALEQGMFLARSLFDDTKPIRPALDTVATAIFTHPQMACVGMTEEEAKRLAQKHGYKIAVYTSDFRHIKYTVTQLQKRTFIKLIVNQSNDEILGIHMVGDETGEIMQGFSVLMHIKVTKTQLDQTIGIHPTVAEELVTMRSPTRIL